MIFLREILARRESLSLSRPYDKLQIILLCKLGPNPPQFPLAQVLEQNFYLSVAQVFMSQMSFLSTNVLCQITEGNTELWLNYWPDVILCKKPDKLHAIPVIFIFSDSCCICSPLHVPCNNYLHLTLDNKMLDLHCVLHWSSGDLVVQRTRRQIGDRAFSVSAPRAWNRLPTQLKLLQLINTFHRQLKTSLCLDTAGWVAWRASSL